MTNLHNHIAHSLKVLMDCGPREGTSTHEQYQQLIGVEHLQMFLFVTRKICGMGKIIVNKFTFTS